MNRTTFLFLALLIVSCIVTVNSRHEARTLITQKTVLTEKVTALQESIRRLELANARVSAKTCPLPIDPLVTTARPAAPKPVEALEDELSPVAPKAAAPKSVEQKPAEPKSVDASRKPAEPKAAEEARPARRAPAKTAVQKDEDALDDAMDRALKR